MVPFVALDLSVKVIELLRPVVGIVRREDPDLARQIRRAASSVAQNLGEGSERAGRDRGHHFRIAAGSHRELMVSLRVAGAWGAVGDLGEIPELLDRLGAILFRLTHPR